MSRVGIRELQRNASAVIRRVARGDRVEITDRGRAVARLVPLVREDLCARLAAEGRLVRGTGDLLALGAPVRPPRGKATASSRLAAARAAER